jgi:hypothetical protein
MYYLAMDTIIQSIEYERLSKRVSPHLLFLHQFTSGQELIPSATSSSVNLFQLETKAYIDQEPPSEIFLLQHPPSAVFQRDSIQQISLFDLKAQTLQIEINYLQKQQAEAIAVGDFTRQLAAEQAITLKLEAIQGKSKLLTEIQDPIEHDKSEVSITSSTISNQSLSANQVDEQIRGLLKKLSSPHSEQNEKESLHSIEDLHQLSIFSK